MPTGNRNAAGYPSVYNNDDTATIVWRETLRDEAYDNQDEYTRERSERYRQGNNEERIALAEKLPQVLIYLKFAGYCDGHPLENMAAELDNLSSHVQEGYNLNRIADRMEQLGLMPGQEEPTEYPATSDPTQDNQDKYDLAGLTQSRFRSILEDPENRALLERAADYTRTALDDREKEKLDDITRQLAQTVHEHMRELDRIGLGAEPLNMTQLNRIKYAMQDTNWERPARGVAKLNNLAELVQWETRAIAAKFENGDEFDIGRYPANELLAETKQTGMHIAQEGNRILAGLMNHANGDGDHPNLEAVRDYCDAVTQPIREAVDDQRRGGDIARGYNADIAERILNCASMAETRLDDLFEKSGGDWNEYLSQDPEQRSLKVVMSQLGQIIQSIAYNDLNTRRRQRQCPPRPAHVRLRRRPRPRGKRRRAGRRRPAPGARHGPIPAVRLLHHDPPRRTLEKKPPQHLRLQQRQPGTHGPGGNRRPADGQLRHRGPLSLLPRTASPGQNERHQHPYRNGNGVRHRPERNRLPGQPGRHPVQFLRHGISPPPGRNAGRLHAGHRSLQPELAPEINAILQNA